MKCAVCENPMKCDVLDQTYHCASCGFFGSTLAVTINGGSRIDEGARERALKPVRLANFEQLLDAIADVAPAERLLDVGCAHGWFLQAAKARGYDGVGVEPDAEMAAVAIHSGVTVIEGYFPDALPPNDVYDLITFNDVFEHLPNVNRMAELVRSRLTPDGVVLINLPVSDGAIFKAARVAACLGVKDPFARMWQQGLPSPHLSYFSTATLSRFMERHGFQLIKSGPLTSVATDGLYERIRYDKAMSATKATIIHGAAYLVAMGTKVLPSDIRYFAFRRSRA